MSEAPKAPSPKKPYRAVTTLRFDVALLKKIDAFARKRGISRTLWLSIAASRAFEEGL